MKRKYGFLPSATSLANIQVTTDGRYKLAGGNLDEEISPELFLGLPIEPELQLESDILDARNPHFLSPLFVCYPTTRYALVPIYGA